MSEVDSRSELVSQRLVEKEALVEANELKYRELILNEGELYKGIGDYGIPLADGKVLLYRVPLEFSPQRVSYLLLTPKGYRVSSFKLGQGQQGKIRYNDVSLDGTQSVSGYYVDGKLFNFLKNLNALYRGSDVESLVRDASSQETILTLRPKQDVVRYTDSFAFSRITCKEDFNDVIKYLRKIDGFVEKELLLLHSTAEYINKRKSKFEHLLKDNESGADLIEKSNSNSAAATTNLFQAIVRLFNRR